MKVTLPLFVVIALAQLTALVQTQSQSTFKAAVHGAGSVTCENWTIIKKTDPPALHYVQLSWVEGFVTALHNYTQNLKEI